MGSVSLIGKEATLSYEGVIMQNYFVTGIVRFKDEEASQVMASLVLNEPFGGSSVHAVGNLKELAAAEKLWSICELTGKTEKVRLYWSHFACNWVATTNAEDKPCLHMQNKPVYRNVGRSGPTLLFAKSESEFN